jgi:hypothetical protein
MTLLQPGQRPRRSSGRSFLFFLAIGGAVGLFLLMRELRLPPPAVVEVATDLPAIGQKGTLTVRVREPQRGIARVQVSADGAGLSRQVLAEVDATDARRDVVLKVPLGRASRPELRPGRLNLEVRAQALGTRLRTPEPVLAKLSREVRLQPPTLVARSQFVHAAQGGAEVVIYEVDASARRDGVQVGSWFFPGFPLPGGPAGRRFALFGVPYDLDASPSEAQARILLVAEDDLGNHAETRFVDQFFPRPMGKDTIELTDGFMKKVTDEVYPRTPELGRSGNLLEDYLKLNRDLRRSNMAQLAALARASQARFLWNETFLPMARAAVMGSFADRRTYRAAGKPVDTQDHLGLDLASLSQAPVQAANAGRAVLASYLGIFGNCVVIDHGYGLMSLYAHLSSMTVKAGDAVARGQEIGRTGGTGLAGGDHLHFTMLVQGLPVTPTEWWDGHWIHDRLKLKLGDVLPWDAAAPAGNIAARPAR